MSLPRGCHCTCASVSRESTYTVACDLNSALGVLCCCLKYMALSVAYWARQHLEVWRTFFPSLHLHLLRSHLHTAVGMISVCYQPRLCRLVCILPALHIHTCSDAALLRPNSAVQASGNCSKGCLRSPCICLPRLDYVSSQLCAYTTGIGVVQA